MNFGEVLSRAWQTIWKHKVLWIFGILASCGQANGAGGSNSSIRFSVEDFGPDYLPPGLERFFNQFVKLPDWQIAIIAGTIAMIVLLLVILAIFLGTIGRIGLIRGTLQADQGADRLIFGELFSGSMPFFWRVFGLNLLVGVVAFLAVLLCILLLIPALVITLGLVILCLIPLICLAIPIGWLVSVVVEQANIAIVVENVGIFEGLRRGWNLFKENLGAMIVMGLILSLGVSLIGGILIGLPLAFAVAPAMVGYLAGTGEAFRGGLLTAGICFVLYLPVLILLSGILRSYIQSTWTLTYLRLSRTPAVVEPIPSPS